MQALLPILWHPAGRSRHRLVQGVAVRWSKLGTLHGLLYSKAPVPVLAWFEALDDGMPGLRGVSAGVLRRRRVAASDMPALRAAPQVKPPTALRQTLNAAGSTGRNQGIDFAVLAHLDLLGHDSCRGSSARFSTCHSGS